MTSDPSAAVATVPVHASTEAEPAGLDLVALAGPRKPHLHEYLAVFAFFGLVGVLGHRVVEAAMIGGAWFVITAAVVGFVLSDLSSGMVHWLFDTWGSTTTPVLGKTFIVPFRIHHSDPKDILVHGFFAINGHNCLVSVPVLVACLFVPLEAAWGAPLVTLLVMLCFGVFATNQFHKWAHMESPPKYVVLLQRLGLVLGREHHEVHHKFPHTKHYCITTGWLNAPLDAIGFFRGLEWAITRVTGVPPRKDDLRTAGK